MAADLQRWRGDSVCVSKQSWKSLKNGQSKKFWTAEQGFNKYFGHLSNSLYDVLFCNSVGHRDRGVKSPKTSRGGEILKLRTLRSLRPRGPKKSGKGLEKVWESGKSLEMSVRDFFETFFSDFFGTSGPEGPRGSCSSREVRIFEFPGGPPRLTAPYRDSFFFEYRQFGGQKSKSSRGNFRASSLPPLRV